MKELFVIWALWTAALIGLRHILRPSLARLIGSRELIFVILAPLVAMISPNYVVFAAILLTLVAVLPQGKEQRLRFYFFGFAALPPLAITIVAPQPVNQLVSVDYAMLLGIACLPAAYALVQGRAWRGQRHDMLFALLCLVLIFIAARGTTFTHLLRTILQVGLVAWLPYYLASRSTSAARDPFLLIIPIILAACALSLVTIFEASRGWLLYTNVGSELSDGSSNPYLNRRGDFIRIGATFEGPTALSLFLGMATVMLIALRKRIAGSHQATWLIALILTGQLCTFARSGLIVTGVGCLAILWFERRRAALSVALFALPMLYLTVHVAASYSPFVAAAFGFTEHAGETVEYRSDLAARILDVLRETPLTGISQEQVAIRLADMIQGQGIVDLVNAPLSIALLSGIPGLLLFLLSTFVALFSLGRLRRERDDELRTFACVAFSGLLAIHAGLITTNYLGRNGLMLYVFLGFACAVVQRKGRATSESQRPSIAIKASSAASAPS